MLDIKVIRENPEALDAACALRRTSWDKERFLELEEKRRTIIVELEGLQADRNSQSKRIGELMRSGEKSEADELKASVASMKDRIAELSRERDQVDADLQDLICRIPNPPHSSVVDGADDSENVEVRRWGTPRSFDFEPKAHWDLGTDLNIIDFERGVKVAGSRFYLLSGQGARLERALISFFLDRHSEAGFREWWCPVITNKETLFGTGQLPKFEEDLFHVEPDRYLIPTAEVMLTNVHRDEILDAADLPLRYCAFTPCFREEAGSAGRDTRGIIRVHQFSKVEMVKFARPEESFDELESMVEQAQSLLEALELPYRVVSLCSGDLGFSAAKCYDLEVWLPSYGQYKEISSCSNCVDFQARRASIRYKDPAQFKGSRYVHTLNGSGLAVGRAMAAILENYQNADGSVTVPSVLVPYMGGLEKIG